MPVVALLKQVKGVGTLIALTYILTLEDRAASERAEMQVAMWDYNRADETPGKANLNCISQEKETPICAWF
jgi:hypothetical protein